MTTGAMNVTEALTCLKASLENVKATIIGEVSELSDKPSYKAVYFTIADDKSALNCLIWRNVYQAQETRITAGMLVEVSGNFSVYPAKGRLNFTVKTIKPAGEGDLRVKVAKLAELLRSQGLMDEDLKPRIPTWINKVAVITSPRGKAIHDILRTLRRRNPLIAVEVYGVGVEGASAPGEMIRALELADRGQADVIILGRGGGSYEDLMPFNDEGLARAIAASKTPVITGIGHEPDTTIADMVASRRASTPTAAAEAVSYPKDQLLSDLDAKAVRLGNALRQKLNYEQQRLAQFEQNSFFTDSDALLSGRWLEVDLAQSRLAQVLVGYLPTMGLQLDAKRQHLLHSGDSLLVDFNNKLDIQAAKLSSLSPYAVLKRGYSITYDKQGRIIRDAEAISVGQELSVRFNDGQIDARVTKNVKLPPTAKENND